MTEGDTLRPPVLRPMRSVSSMKLSEAVPIWVRQLHGAGEEFKSLSSIYLLHLPVSCNSSCHPPAALAAILPCSPAEEGHQGQQVAGQGPHVQRHIQVQHVVGEQVVAQDGGAAWQGKWEVEVV